MQSDGFWNDFGKCVLALVPIPAPKVHVTVQGQFLTVTNHRRNPRHVHVGMTKRQRKAVTSQPGFNGWGKRGNGK